MKRLMTVATLCLALVGCKDKDCYDAMGRFETTEIVISAETMGKVVSMNVDEGSRVNQGELLAVVDSLQTSLQLKQLEAQLDALLSSRPDVKKQLSALKEQLAKARMEEKRVSALLDDKAATQKQHDDAKAAIRILEGQIDAMMSNLNNNTATINSNATALEAKVAQVEDNLDKCRVTSPVNGTVLATYINRGEFATVGRPLMKLGNLEHVFLRAYFTSDQLAQIKLGEEVKVVADFGGDQRIDYIGKVQWIASESEFTPKTIQTKDTRANLVYAVKIAVPNDGRIKLGLYGEVYL